MLSRRTFLDRAFLGTAAAATLAGQLSGATDRRKLHEFGYSQVTLTDGPMAAMHRRVRDHFLNLDEDRLLKVYRQRARMPAPGRDMGGWYDADGFVPGHLIGQFISGLSRLHANSGDPETAAKVRRLVQGYAATFEKDGKLYASPKASDTWACYILDKYIIGLLDAASLANVPEARDLLPRVIDAAVPLIPDHTFDRVGVKNPPWDEPYVLPENLFSVHALTGDQRFLDMAKKYLLDKEFFDPLAEGRNILPGRHGYSHVIALSSAAKAYEVLGDEKYLRAIRGAWDMIAQTQQFASGAWAPQETFVNPHSGDLATSLTATHDHYETPCCFYAHAKLSRYLTGFTGESRYADGLERVLINTILGALDPDNDGGYFYYSDYQEHTSKKYYQRKWPCCAGTLLQSVADYPLDIYFHDDDGVYVNLYAGSEVRWKQQGVPVKLTQNTVWPESEHIELRIEPEIPVDFQVRVRVPEWLDRPATVTVNGKPAEARLTPGHYATLDRRWRHGDKIELRLPFSFRTAPIDELHPNTVALMYGPVMLTAIDPPPALTISRDAIASLKPVSGAPLEFDCPIASGTVRMRPFYKVQREPYSTYFRLA
jgi:uncharacterized protein